VGESDVGRDKGEVLLGVLIRTVVHVAAQWMSRVLSRDRARHRHLMRLDA
jgi:hypothetical protein